MDAATSIQKKFYEAYPPHASEPEYKFEVPSTMKPTITQVRHKALYSTMQFCFMIKQIIIPYDKNFESSVERNIIRAITLCQYNNTLKGLHNNINICHSLMQQSEFLLYME